MASSERRTVIPGLREPKESPFQIARFSNEACKRLLRNKYLIYKFTEQPIYTLIGLAGLPSWLKRHPNCDDFLASQSLLSEVAIRPDPLFLPYSNWQTLEEQRRMVESFSKRLSERIPGTQAIIGKTVDYVELAAAHLKKTSRSLVGFEYDYHGYTRTVTQVGSTSVTVSNFLSDIHELTIGRCDLNNQSRWVYVAPLVVPV